VDTNGSAAGDWGIVGSDRLGEAGRSVGESYGFGELEIDTSVSLTLCQTRRLHGSYKEKQKWKICGLLPEVV
jgi:hypothetical protein